MWRVTGYLTAVCEPRSFSGCVSRGEAGAVPKGRWRSGLQHRGCPKVMRCDGLFLTSCYHATMKLRGERTVVVSSSMTTPVSKVLHENLDCKRKEQMT